MRSFVRHGLVVGAALGAFCLGSGCEGKKATEYVTGVSTQVQVPKDLRAIRLEVTIAGAPAFCKAYAVYNGFVLLPRSLGTFAVNDSENSIAQPLTYTILGIADDIDTSSSPIFTQCAAPIVGQDNVRVLRRSTQPYVKDEILLLPLPMKYSCFDKNCADNETCKGGVCVPATTDPSTLTPYETGIDDGTIGSCFSTALCMGAAVPAIPTGDPCTFAVPETPSAPALVDPALPDPFRPACTKIEDCNNGVTPPDPTKARQCGVQNAGICDLQPPGSPPWVGVNVEVTYDGGHTKEILDLDKDDGFTIPDPTKPQVFKLSQGLCDMVRGTNSPTHSITSIRASGTCAAKLGNQPICQADQLAIMGGDKSGAAPDPGNCKVQPIKPSRSALIVVVDDTPGNADFFQSKLDDLRLPLRDPALANTDIGWIYANDTANGCGSAPTSTSTLLPNNTDHMVDDFQAKALTPRTGVHPNIENALTQAYSVLKDNKANYAQLGVIVLGFSEFNVSSCGNPQLPRDLAFAKKTSEGIRTWAAILTGPDVPDPNKPPPAPPIPGDALGAGALMTGGTTDNTGSQPLPFPQVSNSKDEKKAALQAVIDTLATCVYDVPNAKDPATGKDVVPVVQADPPASDVSLTYANALTAAQVTIANDKATNCTGVNATGWGTAVSPTTGRKQVVICGDACKAYRDALNLTSNFTLAYGQSSLSVPVYGEICSPQNQP